MKNSIKLFALAALLGLGGCHEPDELTPSVVDQGLNTISAQFATGEYKNDPLAKFTAAVTEGQERIVIDVPYYYPENSSNTTSIRCASRLIWMTTVSSRRCLGYWI